MSDRSPVSLYRSEATEPDDKRVIVGQTTAMSKPTEATDGFHTRCNENIHGVVLLHDGTTIGVQLWLYYKDIQKWCLYTGLGTNGTMTCTQANDDNPLRFSAQVNGVDRAYIRLVSPVGSPSAGADAWLLSN